METAVKHIHAPDPKRCRQRGTWAASGPACCRGPCMSTVVRAGAELREACRSFRRQSGGGVRSQAHLTPRPSAGPFFSPGGQPVPPGPPASQTKSQSLDPFADLGDLSSSLQGNEQDVWVCAERPACSRPLALVPPPDSGALDRPSPPCTEAWDTVTPGRLSTGAWPSGASQCVWGRLGSRVGTGDPGSTPTSVGLRSPRADPTPWGRVSPRPLRLFRKRA